MPRVLYSVAWATLFGCTVAATGALAGRATAQDQQMMRRVFGQVEPIAESKVDEALAAGTINIQVVDDKGDVVEGAAIRLGIMESSNARKSKSGVTNDSGIAIFQALPTGTAQAYRVNVPYEGAVYSSTPFRLDHEHGQRVTIRRLPVTQDTTRLLQVLGRTLVEFKDGRLHVSQEARLANVSDSTFVFADGGLKVRLPETFTAFQSPKLMTDQRLAATDDGFEVRGSIPPGRVTLRWAYDIPIRGASVEFEHPIMFRTMEYQVMSDFIEGMELDADGFAPQFVHDAGSRRFLVRTLARKPGDPPLKSVKIGLSGLPTDGGLALVAVAVSLAFLLLGLFWGFRGARSVAVVGNVDARIQDAVGRIRDLRAAHASGKVGPKFYARENQALEDEIALLLKHKR